MSERWHLERLDTGERTTLKRASGSLEFNAPALRAFYKADACREDGLERQRYAAMCMACLWNEQDNPPTLPMQECLRRMCWIDNELQQGMAKRIDVLLETRWGNDDYLIGKLLNLVRMIKSKGEFRPDFELLAVDMRRWNYESRIVQREWLRTIYKTAFDEKKQESNEKDDNKEVTDYDA